MQSTDFDRLRAAWLAKGNPACEHSSTVKEYELGSQTGDRGCTTCGARWTSQGRPLD